MTKNDYITTLIETLSESANNKIYINVSQLAKALGVARDTAGMMVFKLKYVPNGREKMFLINDVAAHIYDQTKCDYLGGRFQ